MIEQVKGEMDAEPIEWITRNVADPASKQVALDYKIRFVPTTIVNGEKWLVGVSSPEQLKEAILHFK